VKLHSILTSAVDGGMQSLSRPGRLTPGKNPSIHWAGGCVDSRTCLDFWRTERSLCPCRGSKPGSSRQYCSRFTDYAIPAFFVHTLYMARESIHSYSIPTYIYVVYQYFEIFKERWKNNYEKQRYSITRNNPGALASTTTVFHLSRHPHPPNTLKHMGPVFKG
jgi:hypothetical protein